ncbi:MAG: hypothetical protein ABL984_12620 [Pyrinomonadaceae bacterium]
MAEPSRNTRDKVRVTINSKGSFYLNGIALKALGDPDALQLMFDRKNGVIGMHRTSIEKKGAYLLKRKSAQPGIASKCFYATSFCDKFKIRPKETMLFLDAHVNRDGILILDLNQVMSTRKRKPDSGQ